MFAEHWGSGRYFREPHGRGVGGKGGVEWTVPYPTPEKLYFLLSTVSGTKMSLGFQYDPNLHPNHQGEAPGLDAKNLVP